MRLTNTVSNEYGSAFLTTPISLTGSTSFHAYFQFQISTSASGGDGLAFVLQNSTSGASACGTAVAGGMGYAGITPSVIVEFDTYQNTSDPNANNVSVMLNGNYTTHYATATPSFTMAGGGVLNAWVDYDSTAQTLIVYLSQNTTKPVTALVSYSLNLYTTLGSQMYLGFSSSTWTGTEKNEHDVFSVGFSTY